MAVIHGFMRSDIDRGLKVGLSDDSRNAAVLSPASASRQDFAITHALCPDGSEGQIVNIDRSSTADETSSRLSAGAIADIVAGAIAVLALVGGLIFFSWHQNKSQKKNKASTNR